jgi:ParB-like chromosome segregation protein Spo0J
MLIWEPERTIQFHAQRIKIDMAKKATKKTNKKAKASKSTKQTSTPKFKVDPEFSGLLPPLTQEEFKVLENSICREGLHEPLLVWKERGILVDGHNRRKICKKHKIKYRIREKSFKDRNEVKLWIWENQEGRRNMTMFQRIEAALKLKDIIAAQAKKNQQASGGAVSKKVYKPIRTDKILGDRAGVSHVMVGKAEKILEKEAKGVIGEKEMVALRNGKAKISRIFKQYCLEQSDTSKTKQPKQGLVERSNSIIRLLKMQVARSFQQTEDCTSLYDKIIEWANAKKAGLEEPQSE